MDGKSITLRALIEKWFAPAALVRVSRFTAPAGRARHCVRVESHEKSTTQVIFFFQHGDGVWRVYPPQPGLGGSSLFYVAL
jgi:hypothetical protein